MEDVIKTYVIPDNLCRRAGMAATWAPVNKLGLFAFEHKTYNTPDKPSKYIPCEASVHQLRQEVLLFEPIFRKLVNEANGTFLSVQQLVNNKTADIKAELLKTSRQYRSIIRACLENLQEETTKIASNMGEQLSNYVTIFYSVECVWHLCEILFVDSVPGQVILPHLLEWIRFHFPKYERKAATIISGDLLGAESNPDYWPTVIGALLQGRIDIVRALLRLHSAFDTNPFRLADTTLKVMPIYNVYSGLSVSEFNMRWQNWTIDCRSKIDAKLFVSHKNLDLIMKLTVGTESAWDEVLPQFEAWYEYLAAWMFFTQPTIKTFELGQYAKNCIIRLGCQNHMKHLDHVLLAAIELDFIQVVKEIQHMSENGWFVTHLTDLLYHCGYLEALDNQEQKLVSSSLRESFLLDYGTLMMGHSSLWQVGLSYLDYCPNNGKGTIELLISRIPLGSEAKTLKILREAEVRDLPNVVSSICRIRGVISLRRGRLGNALTWALRSHDGHFASFLADKFLLEYSNNGRLHSTDLLDNLGSCMLISDRLIFLGKYCEFHKVYQSKQYKEAAALIISLLASKLTPKYFWVTLLSDALPLLESDELVLSSNDTFQLLHCLEERSSLPGLDDKIKLIRLAVARNLARALTFEAQVE